MRVSYIPSILAGISALSIAAESVGDASTGQAPPRSAVAPSAFGALVVDDETPLRDDEDLPLEEAPPWLDDDLGVIDDELSFDEPLPFDDGLPVDEHWPPDDEPELFDAGASALARSAPPAAHGLVPGPRGRWIRLLPELSIVASGAFRHREHAAGRAAVLAVWLQLSWHLDESAHATHGLPGELP